MWKKGASAGEQRPGQILVLFKKLTFLSGVDLFVLVFAFYYCIRMLFILMIEVFGISYILHLRLVPHSPHHGPLGRTDTGRPGRT